MGTGTYVPICLSKLNRAIFDRYLTHTSYNSVLCGPSWRGNK